MVGWVVKRAYFRLRSSECNKFRKTFITDFLNFVRLKRIRLFWFGFSLLIKLKAPAITRSNLHSTTGYLLKLQLMIISPDNGKYIKQTNCARCSTDLPMCRINEMEGDWLRVTTSIMNDVTIVQFRVHVRFNVTIHSINPHRHPAFDTSGSFKGFYGQKSSSEVKT